MKRKPCNKEKVLQQFFSNRNADYIYNTKKLRMYSSKTRLIGENEAANGDYSSKNYLLLNDKNNDVSNDFENNEHNYDVLVTFNGNNNQNMKEKEKEKENENDLSNLHNFSSNREVKNRPSTAMFSISSKISLKNHIERIKSKT